MAEIDDGIGIAEAARRLGVSAHTLRYYERAGLIEEIGRTSNGRRLYGADDLSWMEFLLRLRAVGMGISGMREYATLRAQGSATIARRAQILREFQLDIARRQRELAAHVEAITAKLTVYESLLNDAENHDHAD